MTEEERLQWESEKYSTKVASVMLLDSGRIVIAKESYEVVDIVDGWRDGEFFHLVDTIKAIAAEPLPEYIPPKQRSSRLNDIDLGL